MSTSKAMLNRLFPLLLVSGSVFAASEVDAAIFRIQGATYADEGTFTTASNSFKVSGEFRVVTSYLNADGTQAVRPGNNLTAWNIVVKDSSGNLLNRFVYGYSDPVMGGYTNNSLELEGSSSFRVTCTVVVTGCLSGGSLQIQFDQTFNSFTGNSFNPAGTDFTASISNTGIEYNNAPSVSVSAQADFVPLQLSSLVGIPVFVLSRRFKRYYL